MPNGNFFFNNQFPDDKYVSNSWCFSSRRSSRLKLPNWIFSDSGAYHAHNDYTKMDFGFSALFLKVLLKRRLHKHDARYGNLIYICSREQS